MNEKKQAIALVCVVLSLLTGLFLYHVRQLESRISHLMIDSDIRELDATALTLQKYSYAKYNERIKNLLISSPPIIEAFTGQDRQQLYEHAKIKYDSLQRENPYLQIMQFHLADGTVFLRMHQLDFFGDTPGRSQSMVAAVHQNKTALTGFDICSKGLFFRIVQPIFHQQRYVGAVEFGINAREIITAIEESLHDEIISYYVDDQGLEHTFLDQEQLSRTGSIIVDRQHASFVKQLPADFHKETIDHLLHQDTRQIRIHNHQIFKNFQNESIGGIFILQDITATLQRTDAFLWKTFLITMLLFAATAGLLYFSFERILGSLVREIAMRRQAQSEMQAKENQIRLLLDSTAEGIFGLDHEGKCTFVNRSCLRLLGYGHEDELIGINPHDLIHYRRADGTVFPSTECPMCRSYHDGMEVNVDDEVLWSKDGRAIPVEYHAHPILDNGRLLGSVVTFSDISRRKKAEEDNKRLAAAITHAADEIIITDLNGTIEYVNPAFERISGYTQQDVVGKNPRILKSGHHTPAYYQELWTTIKKGRVWSSRIINRTKNGALIEEDATISPIFDNGGHAIGYVAVKRDVTVKVRMEERLRQANKMETLGTLAGAIAHDFNNILNGIIGFTSIALAETPRKSGLSSNLHEIMRAAATATDLVRQILAFSRKESSESTLVSVQDVAQDVVKLLSSTVPKSIKIKTAFDRKCGSIWGNSSQIHQVIMNIGTNAVQSIGKKEGEIRIEVLQQKPEPTPVDREPDNGHILLRISDTGSGIAPDDLSHIFETYFTTKKAGQGTGLGLATVHDIVKKHHGRIEVTSDQGRGTTFTLFFPVSDQSPLPLPGQDSVPIFPDLGGHVLMVDDTAINVMLGQEILKAANCRVTGSTDSVQALELFSKNPHRFDLVITDQIMPGISGMEMARQMRSIRPKIPIIMISGDENPEDKDRMKELGIEEFLLKPISSQALLAAAARALQEQRNISA